MSRSGRLTGGESGHLLPLDALYAFVIIPFKNFFLRIRCVLFALKPKRSGRSTPEPSQPPCWPHSSCWCCSSWP